MSQTMPLDPFKMWKNIYEQTEANWTNTIHESLKKESFSEGMGETLNHYLQYQELAKETTESYLKQVNMPTRGELADVASLVINVESKVDNLEDKFDAEMNKLDGTKEISQLRKTVTDLERKLDKMLDVLVGLAQEKTVESTKELKK